VTEFADIVRGGQPGRRNAESITLFDSVGFALEDFSVLRLLYELSQSDDSARKTIDLVPDVEDPKDLYGGTIGRRTSRLRKVS
jgi:ornithine cyclodeaminase